MAQSLVLNKFGAFSVCGYYLLDHAWLNNSCVGRATIAGNGK